MYLASAHIIAFFEHTSIVYLSIFSDKEPETT